MQHTVVSVLYKSAVRAIEEDKTFLVFRKEKGWPVKMATLRENMLRRTELDEKLEKTKVTRNVLPFHLDAYRRHYPDEVDELLAGQKRRANSFIQGSQSLKRNEYERNCGSSKEVLQNSSGLDWPSVGIINEMALAAIFETTQDVLEKLKERGLSFYCSS